MRNIRRHQNQTTRQLVEQRLAELRISIAKNRRKALKDGRGKAVTTLPDTPELRMKKWSERARSELSELYQNEIRTQIDEALSAVEAGKDELTIKLGNEFLHTAERGDAQKLQIYIDEGFPATWQDPETGETALHIVAACQARNALRVLLKNNKCDFLLRDAQGRLPSEMAYLHGNDPATARLLGNKERKQAEAQGVKLTFRPLNLM